MLIFATIEQLRLGKYSTLRENARNGCSSTSSSSAGDHLVRRALTPHHSIGLIQKPPGGSPKGQCAYSILSQRIRETLPSFRRVLRRGSLAEESTTQDRKPRRDTKQTPRKHTPLSARPTPKLENSHSYLHTSIDLCSQRSV